MGFPKLSAFLKRHIRAAHVATSKAQPLQFDIIIVDVPNVWAHTDPYSTLETTLQTLFQLYTPTKKVYLLRDFHHNKNGSREKVLDYFVASTMLNQRARNKDSPLVEFIVSDLDVPGQADFKILTALQAEYEAAISSSAMTKSSSEAPAKKRAKRESGDDDRTVAQQEIANAPSVLLVPGDTDVFVGTLCSPMATRCFFLAYGPTESLGHCYCMAEALRCLCGDLITTMDLEKRYIGRFTNSSETRNGLERNATGAGAEGGKGETDAGTTNEATLDRYGFDLRFDFLCLAMLLLGNQQAPVRYPVPGIHFEECWKEYLRLRATTFSSEPLLRTVSVDPKDPSFVLSLNVPFVLSMCKLAAPFQQEAIDKRGMTARASKPSAERVRVHLQNVLRGCYAFVNGNMLAKNAAPSKSACSIAELISVLSAPSADFSNLQWPALEPNVHSDHNVAALAAVHYSSAASSKASSSSSPSSTQTVGVPLPPSRNLPQIDSTGFLQRLIVRPVSIEPSLRSARSLRKEWGRLIPAKAELRPLMALDPWGMGNRRADAEKPLEKAVLAKSKMLEALDSLPKLPNRAPSLLAKPLTPLPLRPPKSAAITAKLLSRRQRKRLGFQRTSPFIQKRLQQKIANQEQQKQQGGDGQAEGAAAEQAGDGAEDMMEGEADDFKNNMARALTKYSETPDMRRRDGRKNPVLVIYKKQQKDKEKRLQTKGKGANKQAKKVRTPKLFL